MSQILVRDLDHDVVAQLKERARRNRRSLQAEVRIILEEAADRSRRRANLEELLAVADRIRREAGPQTSDSVNLIREDRDR